MYELILEREERKGGRRSTCIGIECAKEELPARIRDLAARGFELDNVIPHWESTTGVGTGTQHIVVLHDPAKYEELIGLPGIHAHCPPTFP
jgi:hypothetical protein